jgi:TolA-binding protein
MMGAMVCLPTALHCRVLPQAANSVVAGKLEASVQTRQQLQADLQGLQQQLAASQAEVQELQQKLQQELDDKVGFGARGTGGA